MFQQVRHKYYKIKANRNPKKISKPVRLFLLFSFQYQYFAQGGEGFAEMFQLCHLSVHWIEQFVNVMHKRYPSLHQTLDTHWYKMSYSVKSSSVFSIGVLSQNGSILPAYYAQWTTVTTSAQPCLNFKIQCIRECTSFMVRGFQTLYLLGEDLWSKVMIHKNTLVSLSWDKVLTKDPLSKISLLFGSLNFQPTIWDQETKIA